MEDTKREVNVKKDMNKIIDELRQKDNEVEELVNIAKEHFGVLLNSTMCRIMANAILKAGYSKRPPSQGLRSKNKLEIVLEHLFQRGYKHGLAQGKSNDGEFYAVQDAMKALGLEEK